MFVIGWALAVGIITYQEVKSCHDLPWPPRFIAAALVFGMLDIFAAFISAQLAGVIAIGLILGLWMNKQFLTNCTHQGTIQPVSFNSLQGSGEVAT
jgi:hypothetical protein